MTDRWQDLRACAAMSPDVFYPTATKPDTRTAQAVCAMCPVKQECKDAEFSWAGGKDGLGVWAICGYRAGQTEKARRAEFKAWCTERGQQAKYDRSDRTQRAAAKQSASQGLKRRLRRQEILTAQREEAAA